MKTAIVVGAGIGGVTAAVALERCGWQVTVLERAAELGEVGAGISVWPSAVRVLEQLGVEGVTKAAVSAEPAGMRQPSGRWLVGAGDLGLEIPAMIHRAQLHELITARLGDGVTVRTGITVTGVSQDDAGVTVSSQDGELRAELVVAADGLRSVTRHALHPDHPGPRYSGYTAYRGIATVDISDGGGETWGRGQRFGFAKLIDGRIYWYATANRAAGLPPGPGGAHEDVLKLLAGWHEPIPSLLAATPPEHVLQNDIHDLPMPLVPFANGRVLLVGDAAHAMTPNMGMGACSAIEDAGAIARHLRAAPSLAIGLGGYDRERRPATAKLIKRSRAIGRFGQLDGRALCGLRDGLVGLGGKAAGVRARRRRVEQSRV